MKIILVDDHAMFREALRYLLPAHDATIEIVGEAATAKEAIEVAQATTPDLILMDTMLAGDSGVAATIELRRHKVKAPIVFLSAVSDTAFVVEALSAGAQGYALKESSLLEIVRAIEQVRNGRTYLAPGLDAKIPGGQTPPGLKRKRAKEGLFERLSPRERQVFALAVGGQTNVQIAAQMFIGLKTVETHRSRINEKLFVHSTWQLIRFATLHGLLMTSAGKLEDHPGGLRRWSHGAPTPCPLGGT